MAEDLFSAGLIGSCPIASRTQ